MDDKERPECPVTVEGCPPVITIAADMKWVKRGIWIAVGLMFGAYVKWGFSVITTPPVQTNQVEVRNAALDQK